MSELNEVFRIVWEDVPGEIKQKILTGQYRVFDGVVRDMSNGAKLVKHLPLKAVDACEAMEGSKSLLQIAQSVDGLQAAMTGLVAVSTVAIMGAIVVSTAYLSNKIDKLYEAINVIQKEIHDQNVLLYAEKIANYFGAVEALRELASQEAIVEENKDLILMHLANLGSMRNQLYSFVDSIIQLSDNFSQEGKSLAIDFVNLSLEMIPKGVYIESRAAYKVQRFALGDGICVLSAIKYEHSKEKYRLWCNDKVNQINVGRMAAGEFILMQKSEEIRKTINSEENTLLMQIAA